MGRNSVNITNNPNQIDLQDQNRKIIVTDNSCNKSVTIELPQIGLVTINEGATV